MSRAPRTGADRTPAAPAGHGRTEDVPGVASDEEESGPGAGAPEKRRPGRRRALLIALPVLLVTGLLAGAYFSGLADPILDRVTGRTAVVQATARPVEPTFYDLPEILVNLEQEGRRQHYLKIDISLQLANQRDSGRVAALMPRIVDDVQLYLREFRVEDLKGSDSLLRIRDDLLRQVNDDLRPTTVKDLLFRELLVA